MKKNLFKLMALAIAAITFAACEDVPAPYDIPTSGGNSEEPVPVANPTGTGTQADPYNVAAIINVTNALADNAASTESYYIKGIVKGVSEQYSTQYGNATFTIADDENSSDVFTIYRAYYFDNKKYTDGELLKEGDEVIVIGKVTKYVGSKGTTLETVQGQAYLYSLNGVTGSSDAPGTKPTEAKAVSIADFNVAAESTDVWYQLTGTVKNLKDGDQYGNFDLEDETGSVYVYGVLSEKGGAKKLFQELVEKYGIKNGSKITIIGNRGSYNGKIEVMNAYFVSIEGGGDNTGNEVKVISIADFNAAAESTDVWYQLTGTVKNLKDGDQYGNFDLEDETGSVYVYGVLSEKGGAKKLFQDLVAKYGIKNGSKITIIGNRGSYKDKIEVMNAYFVKVE